MLSELLVRRIFGQILIGVYLLISELAVHIINFIYSTDLRKIDLNKVIRFDHQRKPLGVSPNKWKCVIPTKKFNLRSKPKILLTHIQRCKLHYTFL